jgi:tetratricopeptide (TPR) repeat protein
MNTTIRVLIVVAAFAAVAAGQSQVIEVRADGSTAKSKALKELITRLEATAEIKALRLKANQLQAFVPAIVRVQEESSSVVAIKVKVPEVALRLDRVRHDPTAANGMMSAWKEDQVRQPQLLANDLVRHAYDALAKTEESPASARIASVKSKQRALHLAEMAVAIAPGSSLARLALGDALMESNPVAAEEEYQKSLKVDATSAAAHVKLAEALRRQDKTAEAVAEIREALRLDPTSAPAHTDLGYILGTQQSPDAAIDEYRQALKFDPDYIEAHNYLAIAYSRQGKIPDAVAEFREMTRVDPDSVLGYYNMGIALADMELDDESAEAFRNAIRVNPNHFNSHFNLGEMFRLEGKFDEAVKQWKEYLRLAPDTPANQRNFRRAREFVETHENKN